MDLGRGGEAMTIYTHTNLLLIGILAVCLMISAFILYYLGWQGGKQYERENPSASKQAKP